MMYVSDPNATADILDEAAEYIAQYDHNQNGGYFKLTHYDLNVPYSTICRYTPPAYVLGAMQKVTGHSQAARERLREYLGRSITNWSDTTTTPTVLTTLRTVAALTRQEAR